MDRKLTSRNTLLIVYKLGPIVAAYIGYKQNISWRWVEWVVLLLDGMALFLIIIFQKESFAPRLLHYRAKQYRKITGNQHFKTATEANNGSDTIPILVKCFTRPFLFCTEPIVLAFTFYLAVVYIILFTFL